MTISEWLEAKGVSMTIEFSRIGWMHWDKDQTVPRDIYTFALVRGNRAYSAEFGQSLHHSGEWVVSWRKPPRPVALRTGKASWEKPGTTVSRRDWQRNPDFQRPSAGDILGCLTWSDPGTWEEFSEESGDNSHDWFLTWEKVVAEYKILCTLLSEEEIEELRKLLIKEGF